MQVRVGSGRQHGRHATRLDRDLPRPHESLERMNNSGGRPPGDEPGPPLDRLLPHPSPHRLVHRMGPRSTSTQFPTPRWRRVSTRMSSHSARGARPAGSVDRRSRGEPGLGGGEPLGKRRRAIWTSWRRAFVLRFLLSHPDISTTIVGTLNCQSPTREHRHARSAGRSRRTSMPRRKHWTRRQKPNAGLTKGREKCLNSAEGRCLAAGRRGDAPAPSTSRIS